MSSAGNKKMSNKEESAVLKLQSFVRGCVCRARVSDMLATMIQEMLVADEASKSSRDHGSFATLETAPVAEGKLLGSNDDDDDSEEEVEMIDGVLFPKSIPSSVFDQSFQSLGSAVSFSVDGSASSLMSPPETPASVQNRISMFQKGNASSEVLGSSRSSLNKGKGVPVSTLKKTNGGAKEKRGSVTSIGSVGSLKDQLGFSASDFDRCESPTYGVPFLKAMPKPSDGTPPPPGDIASKTDSKRDELKKTPSVQDLISKREEATKRGISKRSSSCRGLMDGSSHSVASRRSSRGLMNGSAHSIASRRSSRGLMDGGSAHSVASMESISNQLPSPTATPNKSAISKKLAVFEGSSQKSERKGASLFAGSKPQKNQSVPRGRQPVSDPSSWIKKSEKPNATNGDSSVTDTVAETVATSIVSSETLTIAERIDQLRAANRELPSEDDGATANVKIENASKRLDYTTKLYMMENSATKIQALVRGFFYRRRNQEAQEATITVVKWLKQYKLLDEDATVSTLEIPEELREMAVEALAAEIDKDAWVEDGSEVEASDESSEAANEGTAIASLEQRKMAFERGAGNQSSPQAAVVHSPPATIPPKKVHTPMLSERMKAFEQPAKEKVETTSKSKTANELPTVSAALLSLNKKQYDAATKIQALVRGFIERKFDVGTMLTVVAWITEQQEEQISYDPEDYEPEASELETAWTFLESNNTWTKDMSKGDDEQNVKTSESDDDSIHVTENEAVPEKINVNELLATWEYLLAEEKSVKLPTREKVGPSPPTEEDLVELEGWMEVNHTLVDVGGELGFLGTQTKKSKGGSSDIRVIRTSKGVRTVRIGQSDKNLELAQVPIGGDGTSHLPPPKNKILSLAGKYESSGGISEESTRETIVLSSKEGRNVSSTSKSPANGATTPSRAAAGVKVYRDASVSTSHARSNDAPVDQQLPKSKNMKDMVEMWKWLESHGMDMKQFKQRQQSQKGPSEITKPLSIDSLSRDKRKEPFNAHLMHDEPRGGADGIEYIKEEARTEALSGPEYSRHKMHDEMYSSKGDGVVYIDEDLSASYTDLSRPSRGSLMTDQPRRHYSYNTHKMHDEMQDSKDDGVVYIDEDLSASYLGLQLEDQSRPKKPTMKAMVNYYNFSAHHSRKAPNEQPQDQESLDTPEEAKDWKTSAENNDFLGTLAWLKSKGIELNQITPDATPSDVVPGASQEYTDHVTERSDNEMSKSDTLKDSLDWLQSKGYGKKGNSATGPTTDEENESREATVSNGSDSSSSSESEDEEHSESTLPEETAEALLPKKTDMTDTLKWLQSRGFRTPKKACTVETDDSPMESQAEVDNLAVPTASPSPANVASALNWLEDREREEDEKDEEEKEITDSSKSEEKTDGFKDVLHSLSWLKKHGFALDKSASEQTMTHRENAAESRVPSRNEIVEALGTVNDEKQHPETVPAVEKQSDDTGAMKSTCKPTQDMEKTLQWLTSRGMKLPKKSKKKNSTRTSKTTETMAKHEDSEKTSTKKSSSKHEVVSVFSKTAKNGMTFDASPALPDPAEDAGDLNSSDELIDASDEPRKKTTVRMTKVPNEKKKSSTPMNTDDMSSALQWLQFKKGISLDKAPTPKRDASSKIKSNEKSETMSRNAQDKSGKRGKRKSVSSKEISVDKAKETVENIFKLSNHPKSSGKGSTPSKNDMEQALSWLKLREGRRQAQLAASSSSPAASAQSSPSPRPRSEKTQLRVRKPKSSADGSSSSDPVNDVDNSASASSLDVSGHSSGKSSSRGRKKSKSLRSAARSENEPKPKTRNSSRDKKRKSKSSESGDDKPSKSDMTKALMFLQQRRNVQAKSTETPNKIETKPQTPVSKKKKKTVAKSTKGADKEETTTMVTENIQSTKSKASKPQQQTTKDEEPTTKEQRDYYNALNFLRGNAIDAPEDEPYFAKLDSMLPLKTSQSKEDRAKEMAKALKWIKKQSKTTGTPLENDSAEGASESKDPPSGTVSGDYKNCVKWLTSSNRDSIPDAKLFKKLDSMLPKKTGQSPKDRAKDMVKALGWVKKSSLKKEGNQSFSSPGNPSTRKTSKSPGRRSSKSPGRRTESKSPRTGKPKLTVRKGKGKQNSASEPPSLSLSLDDGDAKNALQWLKKENRDDLEDAAKFKKIDSMLPKKAGQTPEQRAVEMSKALKLIRKRDKDNGEKLREPKPVPTAFNGEEKQAFLFLMAKLTGKDFMSTENADALKKVDNMMPSKTGQAPEDRAKEMVKMMTWLKKKGKI
ncbi:MAG: hypothetical protein SGILL_002366 [Bacillariaceae sp.]